MGKNKYAILILAAGSSERLGRPKQLVKWNQSTLLNHTIEQACKSSHTDVYIALGGNQAEIRPSITLAIPIINIPNWRDGMGSSISRSLAYITTKNYEAIILSVCDQPYISCHIFEALIRKFEKENLSIVTSNYKNSSGPPTLFARKHFPALLKLKGDVGAKKVVKNNLSEATKVQFSDGDIDIDTEDDLYYLTISNKEKN